MKCFTALALFACIVMASAEPPVPQSQYLPPNQQPQQQPSSNYLPPTRNYQPPSSNYLPPQRNAPLQPPQNTYAAPPQNTYGAPAPPQNTYGAPAVTSAIFTKQAQQQQSSGSYGSANQRIGSGYGNNNNAGYGQNDEEDYGPAKYEFKYDVQDYESGNDFGHMESRDGDYTTGRYYVLLPDGRKQIVEYEADRNGYRPTIRYEQVNNGLGGGAGGRAGGGYDNNAQAKFGGYQ